MTSEEQPTPTVPALPEVVPAGTPGERARALLRSRPYRRLWTAQLISGTADRSAFLVLLALTVVAAGTAGQFGGGYRGAAFALTLVFAARLLAAGLVGVALLGPLHRLVTGPLDRRWTLIAADGLRALLIGIAPWWPVWTHQSTPAYLLLGTVFVSGAAERVWSTAKGAITPTLLPVGNPYAAPAEQRPSAANLETVRTIDMRTGWATVPLAAVVLIACTLVNNLLAALGSDWLRYHQLASAAVGSAVLFGASAVLLFQQQDLPARAGGPVPVSPLQGLKAPTDATPGPALGKGRTGSAPYFTFAIAAAYAAVAGTAALAFFTAAEHGAGPIGYGLLVLAATGLPWLGLRLTRVTLPALSRRRLLAIGLLIIGAALILAGLVFDYVLILLLTSVAAVAAGLVIGVGRALLAQEVEEARLPKVTEHLYAVLRLVVGAALLGMPLLAAAYGEVDYGNRTPGTFTFVHGGAAIAVATAGVLTLALAGLVLLRTDDQRGTVPFGRELLEALGGGREVPEHRVSGTGFFIALEGGDGAGKSTQAQALAEWIRSKGHEVVLTREPGGSPVGQRLRGLVLDVGNTGLSHRAEALIYAADRAEHVENVIRPALARGAVVITDRYMDSSIAYQGAGRDLAATEVARISRWATGGLVPDLTVVLDVDPERARERFTEALDRLENEPVEFHTRVRAGFLALAAADPARYLVVDAGKAPAMVTTAIRHRLDRELPLSEQEKEARRERERLAREEAERRAAEEARQKAEAEAAERKRQELLEQLRAEQAEKERLAREEAARKQAEEDRKKAEEARLAAEAEAARQAARAEEERKAEEARLAAEAEEKARRDAEAAAAAEFQRQRDVQREEQRRRAEEALQRAEAARQAEAAAAAARAANDAEAVTEEISERDRQAAVAAADRLAAERAEDGADGPESALERTAVLPAVSAPGAADETAVLPAVPGKPGGKAERPDAGRPEQARPESVRPEQARPESAVERTAVLLPVADAPGAASRGASGGSAGAPGGGAGASRAAAGGAPAGKAKLLPVRPVEDRVPPGLWRAEPTEPTEPAEPAGEQAARPPRRPSWAEETPMDDLPSLTDSLLGSREEWARWDAEEPDGEDGGRGRKRRK
ncbi:dTMP kinase [Kitasatospora sp. NPDC006697]|uniref:dTMP kinase n=1 Tax=Kitasatospora sp. NPDC006697 TaxID=3364020 RepID=UPI0036BEA0F2